MAGSLYQRTECDGLRILSTLPLTEVDILVRNPSGASEDAVWSKSDRKEYADGLRELLLEPRVSELCRKLTQVGGIYWRVRECEAKDKIPSRE